jgi:P27 family predicted phage terminase small subunit
MRGPKPKPTARRRLDGNPGKRRLNDHEPEPPPLEAATLEAAPASEDEPTPPELADQAMAQAEWRRVVPMLRRCRQITEADRSALIALCLEWARYLEAMGEVRKLGMVVKAPSGYPITNPFLSIALKALGGCAKLWPELGLTPSSRSRIAINGPGPGGDAFSEFDRPPEDSDLTH